MNTSISPHLLDLFTPPQTNQGFMISFEGIEGSGKSTQIKMLEKYLQQNKWRTLVLREPGGTNFGEQLRSTILKSQSVIHPLAECHLFLSSRVQLLVEKILPFLKQPHSVVLLDRYIDSSLAYQGVAGGLGIETVLTLHQFHPLNLVPHRTYFLDIDLSLSLERQRQRGDEKDYFESQHEDFYQKLILGYHTSANIFKNRIKTLQGDQKPEMLAASIVEDFENIL